MAAGESTRAAPAVAGRPTIHLFGRPRATAGELVALPGKAYPLLALLAAGGGEVEREHVRGMLWGDLAPERQAGNLRQLVLRIGLAAGALPSPLVTTARTLALDPVWRVDRVDLDRLDLTDLIAAGAADDCLSGDLLDGVPAGSVEMEDWLNHERRLVAERRAVLLSACLRQHGPDIAPERRVDLARLLVAADPADEFGHRCLIEHHAAEGDLSRARRAYADCKAALADYGARPSRETAELAARLGLEEASAAPRPVPADPLGAPRLHVARPWALGDEPTFDRLAIALAEEVTIGLAQHREFRVVASHAGGRAMAVPATDAHRTSGLDYLVTVGLKGPPSAPRAACRLTRMEDGTVLLADEYTIAPSDLAGSLDRQVRRAVANVVDEVERAETALPLDEQEASAWRLYVEGRRSVGDTRLEKLRNARRWFRAAVRRHGSFSGALAGHARCLTMEWLVRGMGDVGLLDEPRRMAESARQADPNDGRAWRELGFVATYQRRHAESLDFFREARRMSPTDGDLHADYADALLHDGREDEALALIEEAYRLTPAPPDYYRWIEGSIHFQREDYDKAAAALMPVAESPATSRLLAATHAMRHDRVTARRYAGMVRENYPEFRVDDVRRIVPDRRPRDADQLVAALRLAGLD